MFKKRLVFLYLYAFFSLGVLVTGSVAWFAANSKVNATDMEVKVGTSGCELANLHLYKFNYSSEGEDEIFYDYLHPENGEINRYEYNREHNAFGYIEDEEFIYVNEMNLYDPLESIITGSELKDLNTNVIYEVTLKYGTAGTYPLSVLAKLIDIEKNNPSDILCSSCMDFDVFTKEEIQNEELTENLYKPSYIVDELTDEEDLFYRISYLSHIADSHSNLYEDTSKDTSILYSGVISTDEEGYVTIFINVNYSPEMLTSFQNIAGLQVVYSICDYKFLIQSEEAHDE